MSKTKKLPLGVEVKVQIDQERYLPFRIHKLWVGSASPRAIHLKNGITIKAREWRILLTLATFGPGTNSDIANSVLMDMATTTRAIQKLLDIDFVTARPHKLDGRKQVVTLTQKGADAHDEIATQRLKFAEDLVAALSKAELSTLFKIIDKLDARIAYLNRKEDNPFAEEDE